MEALTVTHYVASEPRRICPLSASWTKRWFGSLSSHAINPNGFSSLSGALCAMHPTGVSRRFNAPFVRALEDQHIFPGWFAGMRVKMIGPPTSFGVDTPAEHGLFTQIVRKMDDRPLGLDDRALRQCAIRQDEACNRGHKCGAHRSGVC